MQPFAEKHQPRTIEGFYGLDRPKAIMSNFVTNPYSSAWLFVGDSGLGKTTLALALQKVIGGQLYHVPSRKCDLAAVDELAQKCAYAPWSGRFNFVLVDEVDQATKAAQLAFLSLLDATAFPKDTIFIFTANSTKLEDRFMSRCRVIEFEKPAEPDVQALLESIWKQESQGRATPNYGKILKRAAGNVRTALMELELELIATPKPAPVLETRWFDAMNRELGWDAIEERLARNDFAGVRAVEVEVYA